MQLDDVVDLLLGGAGFHDDDHGNLDRYNRATAGDITSQLQRRQFMKMEERTFSGEPKATADLTHVCILHVPRSPSAPR